MASILSAGTTSGTALNFSGDTSGVLQLATNGTTTAITVDTSQNVGIGTTAPTTYGDGNTKLAVISATSGTNDINIRWGTNSVKGILYCNDLSGAGVGIGSTTSAYLGFLSSGTERMRIDTSGNLCVGSTSPVLSGKITSSFAGSTINGMTFNDTTSTSAVAFCLFSIGGSLIGNISRVASTSAVAYNTTSDQRLKSNIADSQSVLDKLMTVKVRQYDWTEGQVHQDYGFIAQELEPVLSGIVSKGKTEEDMWQLDYAKLTPHLVKAIQELKAINDTQAETINAQSATLVALTARVTALEGA